MKNKSLKIRIDRDLDNKINYLLNDKKNEQAKYSDDTNVTKTDIITDAVELLFSYRTRDAFRLLNKEQEAYLKGALKQYQSLNNDFFNNLIDVYKRQGLEEAWHTAYSNDPKDFANKQDQFEYDNYYIPIENALKSLGIDLASRRDCIKGLVCGMANLFGNSGAKRLIKNSGITNDLGDKEFVTKLCDYLVSYCPKHYAYGKSYANRYKNEKNDCLRYITN